MQEFYYELVVKVPLQFKELFLDFIYDLSGETIQEDGNTLILRSECELDDLYYNLELLALELSAVTAKEVKIEGTVTKKENRDWIESYKSGVEPVAIGSFYVRAPWHKKDSNAIDVIIEPALAFGSGHHESTSLCILMLEEVVKSGCRLLDVGSGSGILGICAAKLGAKVDFCDTDEAAVDVSRKNYALNSVSFVNSWVGGCSLSM